MCQGRVTYCQLITVNENYSCKNESDLQFCEWLASEVGVGAVPGSSFFREPVNNLIRLHFAKKDDTLLEALDRLSDLDRKATARG